MMISGRILGYVVRKVKLPTFNTCERRFYSKKTSKPLRILFCGSDAFSCEALRALRKEQQRDLDGIASIDVLCRPGKPSGRSMKLIKEVPLKKVAEELGLTIHERDTFTGWELPKPDGEAINLIIAVSFGLFVPPRILNSAEYGGLNVHPSLLPNFRGPAPLHHTIIQGERFTGVTLQTLDDKSFDHGTILDQTPPRGLPIEVYRKGNYSDLLDLITPIAAEMLVKGIRNRIFVQPLHQLTPLNSPKNLINARKIQTEDKEIDWQHWDAVIIDRRYRALGPLWNTMFVDDKTQIRIKFEDFELVERPTFFKAWHNHEHSERGDQDQEKEQNGIDVSQASFMVSQTNGHRVPLPFIKDGEAIIIPTRNMALRVSHITAAGMGKQAASRVVEGFQVDKIGRTKLGARSRA